jgi:hypothetical protein
MGIGTALVLAAGLLLAGCSGDPPASGAAEGATGSALAIAGVVVTTAIVPLEGVALRLEPAGLETVSDSAGNFRFEGLREGSSTLQASHPGYVTTTLAIDVGGAEPPILKVVMEPDPKVGAFVDAYSYDGFLQESFNAAGARGNSGGGPNFTIGLRAPDLIQMELVWQSTQALGTWLDVTAIADDGGAVVPDIGRADGQSPLLLTLNSTAIQEGKLGPKVVLDIAIFAGQEPVAADRGVGVVANQSYRLITHMFYGYLPPEGWRFSSDGEPPPPP